MNVEYINDNQIHLIKDNIKYILTFKILNQTQIIIKAQQQENKNILIPYVYERILNIDDLPKREGIEIKNMETFLKGIIYSSKNNKLHFNLTQQYLNLSYDILYEEYQINIPRAYTNECNQLSSTLSENAYYLIKN